MNMLELLKQPWPWYVGGLLIGLMVPALLIAGNKTLGVSGSLRDMCAACVPFDVPFLKYDWKKNTWNLFFVAGILLGGFVSSQWLSDAQPESINPETLKVLSQQGIHFNTGFVPNQLFNWSYVATVPGFLIMIVGGFLIGFGTRYAGGCTSGHGVMGLASLQWPSLVAVACFFGVGILSANYLLPLILKLQP